MSGWVRATRLPLLFGEKQGQMYYRAPCADHLDREGVPGLNAY
jgi:hypothetical protein